MKLQEVGHQSHDLKVYSSVIHKHVCVCVCLYPFRSVLITDLFMKITSHPEYKCAKDVSKQHQPVKYGLLEELHPVPVGLGLKV